MYIAIYAAGLPFNGETIPNGFSLGGSETAAYYMAKELAAIGHKVIIFTTHQKTGMWDGVEYQWIGQTSQHYPFGDRFQYILQTPYDVLIFQRRPGGFIPCYNTKLNIWWLHDLALLRNVNFVNSSLFNIDRIVTVSEWHKQQVSKTYDIASKFIIASQNGIDYSYQAFQAPESGRIKKSLIYCARPERGLENLVGKDGIMEKLIDCHLYVAGYDNTTPHMKSYYEYLWGRCDELPNVTNLGHLSKDDLYRQYKCMELYVYPSTFEETSCITALECQAAGLPFIGCNRGALKETVGYGGADFINLEWKKDEREVVMRPLNDNEKNKFIKKIRFYLDHPDMWKGLHNKCKKVYQPWSKIAQDWSDKFELLLADKCRDKNRLYKHYEYMSDIIAMTKAGATENNYPNLRKSFSFFLDNTYKEHYKKYYEFEKNRGVKYGPEKLDGQQRYEHTVKIIENLKPARILDYGCAHGHYTNNLAQRFKKCDFTGIDIEQSNIEIARTWAQDEKIKNAEFYVGTFEDMDYMALEFKYDVILCQEVLEHVPDPKAVITKLKEYLTENGTLIISTPYGPWESLGTDKMPEWCRAHIHHFERQDIIELYGTQINFKLLALPHMPGYGHYFVTFQNGPEEIGKIDYVRKNAQQSPRETISACIIAKDSENKLGACIESIKSFVDEIIVGIDNTTTDETKRIAEKYGAKIIGVDSPLKIGFEEDRNIIINYATMDWILWIDSDEQFQHPERISKYLRQNAYDAYGIKQHHFAVEPEPVGCFKTDFPARIFRNHKGIKFFGVVHEHPEKELNAGPGRTAILQDVAITHIGFLTEKVRRERFERNFPRMALDRKKYPTRKLGHFLWIRDLAHYNDYHMEKNGMVIDDIVIKNAHIIIDTWRDLLKSEDLRMIIETVPWYSKAVMALGGGIDYTIGMKAQPWNPQSAQQEPVVNAVRGTFQNTEDIDELSNRIKKAELDIFNEKYF